MLCYRRSRRVHDLRADGYRWLAATLNVTDALVEFVRCCGWLTEAGVSKRLELGVSVTVYGVVQ